VQTSVCSVAARVGVAAVTGREDACRPAQRLAARAVAGRSYEKGVGGARSRAVIGRRPSFDTAQCHPPAVAGRARSTLSSRGAVGVKAARASSSP